MIDADEALNSVLASDRPTAQRVEMLHSLREELRGEKAILTLLAAAQAEKTLDLRRAFFEFAARSDITRISDRAAYIDGFLYFAAIEEEASLRRTALSRLGEWSAQNAAIEDVLVESLLCELDVEIQRICIAGLKDCVRLKPENMQRLLEFLSQSPAQLRGRLIKLLVRFDADTVQAALVHLLDPSERNEIRVHVLDELANLPRLDAPTLEALQTFIVNEPDADLQARAIAILRDSKQIDAELFQIVFNLFARFPDRTDLIEAMRHRLASFPELITKLGDFFRSVRSAQTRVRIVQMLDRAEAVPFFIEALSDSNWQVRRAAVQCLVRHHAGHAAEIERAVIGAAGAESIVTLREAMAGVFTSRNHRDAAIDRGLLEWMDHETEPRVERVLARSLAAIPPSSDSDGALIRAYRKILLDPAFDEFDPAAHRDERGRGENQMLGGGSTCREEIVAQLRNFAFSDSPELAQCLRTLLWRTGSIEEVDELYARLRELEPDVRAHADLILALFFRFVGEYPRAPLDKWVNDFQTLAPSNPVIRAQIPYIVKLTGATWLDSSADAVDRKSMVLSGLMEQIRRDNWIEAGRLLRESWESRSIRKSDMILFFKKLLRKPGEEGLMQSALVMMAKGGVTTPDILDLGFAYLDEFPRGGTYTHMISEFLQGKNQDSTPMRSIGEVRVDLEAARQQDPHYRQGVFEAFNQRGLNRYFRLMPEEMEAPPPITNWNEWEYEKWAGKGIEWSIASMFLALKPFERIAELLAAPPDPAETRGRSIHYLLLLWLWQNPNDGLPPNVLDALLRGIGALFRNTAERRPFVLLRDRATLVFRMYWTRQINSQTHGRAVAPDLAELAAEIYAELCAISGQFDTDDKNRFPAVFPEMLQGLSSAHLKACWRFDDAVWERLFKQYFETADEETKAQGIYDSALLAETEARFDDALACYKELLSTMSKSALVKQLGSTVKYSMADCDPNRKSNPADENMAKTQHDFMLGQIQKNKIDQALRTLDRLMKRFWPTAYFKERRAEFVVLRKDLAGKVSGGTTG